MTDTTDTTNTIERVDDVVDERRLAAALQNLESAKARVERDAKLVHEETRRMLIADLLPVLDNLDRAIAAADGEAPNVIEGVRMVQRQLESVLVGYGLVRFDAVGDPFDPAMHDATSMIAVTDPEQHRCVVEQLQPGYRFGERLLRAARVVVGTSSSIREERRTT